MRYLSYALYPLLLAGAAYSLVYHPHKRYCTAVTLLINSTVIRSNAELCQLQHPLFSFANFKTTRLRLVERHIFGMIVPNSAIPSQTNWSRLSQSLTWNVKNSLGILCLQPSTPVS